MAGNSVHYTPALHFRWLTWLYDPLLKWVMREEGFKRRLIQRASIQTGQCVLDLGCGTGTLTVMLKKAFPGAQVTGLDSDPEVLSIAREKADQAHINIAWDEGYAFELPYPDNSFDVTVSSMVIHHLRSLDKVRAFREVRRVLRPGSWFHMVDFGHPYSTLTRFEAAVMKNLEQTADNYAGRIVPMLQEGGFEAAEAAEKFNTLFGPIWFYQARKSKG